MKICEHGVEGCGIAEEHIHQPARVLLIRKAQPRPCVSDLDGEYTESNEAALQAALDQVRQQLGEAEARNANQAFMIDDLRKVELQYERLEPQRSALTTALTALVKKWKSGEGWKPGATSSRQIDICADDLATLLRETGA